ncbi:MAG: formylglycine-generating enzyme family protein, partial [Holophagales bacterium]|nr:formylglycine-generating enzyme family protein [Holophagales bacterium]
LDQPQRVKLGGDVQIELDPELASLRFVTDEETVELEAWTRPAWATSAGRDGYGLWASFEVEGVEQRMRWIPPGRFLMGSPESEAGRDEDESPQHPVVLTEGCWLAETPCTQALWEAVMGENPSRFQSPGRPVEQVRWEDCQVFLDRLNFRFRGLEVELPTEAEWEYACRAGTEAATWRGDLRIFGANDAPILDEIAWYGGNSGVGFDLEEGEDSSVWREKQHPHERAGTRGVSEKSPNPWGLCDMLGNVYEWCWDWSGSYAEKEVENPEGPEEGRPRVIRGGSWGSDARRVRAAYRGWCDPGLRYDNLGFRLSQGPGEGRGVQEREIAASGAEFLGRVDRERGGRARSRRSRAWVDRLGWAVDGGLDGYGRWASIEVKGVRHRLRWMYPGRFWMGSSEEEAGRWDDEGPRHEVALTEGFWLGETPCTQDLWEAVTGENPSEFKAPQRPVERVSWEDCLRFFEKLERQIPGFGGRLPTEAQWEYACRAGTNTATWAGDLEIRGERNAPILDEIAWYGGNSGSGFDLPGGWDTRDWAEMQYPHPRAGTREVGQKLPNPWGLYDMLGNVYEWCSDHVEGGEGYPGGSRVDPMGEKGPPRVIRGGSWHSIARSVRAASRYWRDPGARFGALGFRLSRGPGPAGAEPREESGQRSGIRPPRDEAARSRTPGQTGSRSKTE